ncbi:MAG: hypothetical protein AB1646_24490 [Thermodesulfobacteriota bacterium]
MGTLGIGRLPLVAGRWYAIDHKAMFLDQSSPWRPEARLCFGAIRTQVRSLDLWGASRLLSKRFF